VNRHGRCAETKSTREYMTKCVTILNFLRVFLREVFEDAHKYRISAYIISKKEDGNKKEQKSSEILSKPMWIKGQSFKMNSCVRKRDGGLVPGIVVGNSSSSLAKDQFGLLQFRFSLPDLSVLCRVLFWTVLINNCTCEG